MIKNLLTATVFAGAMTVSASAATFNFTNSSGNPLGIGYGSVGTTKTYTGPDGSVKVTAGMYTHGAIGTGSFTPGDQYAYTPDEITENGYWGLGLSTYPPDDHYVDGDAEGSNGGEMLTFAFEGVVKLTDAMFSFWNDGNATFTNSGEPDVFDLFIDGILVASNISSVAEAMLQSGGDLIGTVFGFGGNNDYEYQQSYSYQDCRWYGFFRYCETKTGTRTKTAEDAFKVMSLTVDPVTVVPVPAALPMLGAGLVGLGLIGRRRKAKAAA